MSQTHTIGKTATSVQRDPDGTLRVVYHATEVVTVDPNGTITLRTGGWKTNTTKARMNQTANQFGLGFQVGQSNFQWAVSVSRGDGGVTPPRVIPFDKDTLIFHPKHDQVLSL